MNTPSSDGAETPASTKAKPDAIAALNDKFRALQDKANTYITLELAGKGHAFVIKVLTRLRDTSKPIGEDADHEERAYGYFTMDGTSVEWTIDYYDLNGETYAEHPVNANTVIRTLTVNKA